MLTEGLPSPLWIDVLLATMRSPCQPERGAWWNWPISTRRWPAHLALQRRPPPGVEEIVPAARTLLITYRPAVQNMAGLVHHRGPVLGARVQRGSTLVEITCITTAKTWPAWRRCWGIAPAELVRRHTGSEYTAAFTRLRARLCLPERRRRQLNVPRRSAPRTRVPKGSVALAGLFSTPSTRRTAPAAGSCWAARRWRCGIWRAMCPRSCWRVSRALC